MSRAARHNHLQEMDHQAQLRAKDAEIERLKARVQELEAQLGKEYTGGEAPHVEPEATEAPETEGAA